MNTSNKKNITLIGPIFPYRGGIAQYTEQLKNALENECNLQTISFKRLYPKWLYPGKDDGKLDHSNMNNELKGVDYIIDAYWPFSLNKTIKHIEKNGSKLVVISWWTLFWQPAFAYLAWRLKRRGVKTSFLCHNLTDHKAPKIAKKISFKLLKTTNLYISHTKEQADQLKKVNSNAEVLFKPHPIYNHFPDLKIKLKKRGKLELLYFGFIRPYKGVDVFLKALNKLDDSGIYATIVGETWGSREEIKNNLGSTKTNVEFVLKYVSEQDAANYFGRADIVVLPYLSATGSGVVTLAYHYGKPVIASSVGGLKEVVTQDGTGWLVQPNSINKLSCLIKKVDRKTANSMQKNIAAFVKKNNWQAMAKSIVDLI